MFVRKLYIVCEVLFFFNNIIGVCLFICEKGVLVIVKFGVLFEINDKL